MWEIPFVEVDVDMRAPLRPSLMIILGTVLLGLGCTGLAIGGSISATSPAPCSRGMTDAWPRSAHLVTERDADQLQSALDKYGSVRLQAFADYTKHGGPRVIRLSSGQRLYGLLGTKIGRVVVSPGSADVLLQGISTEGIEFPRSAEVTHDNCFFRISGGIAVNGATLQHNLFVGLSDSPIDIDTRTGGYLKQNRFIGVMVHGQSPGLRMYGDPRQRSSDNLFLWLNLLTPRGEGIEIKNQKSVTFVGLDAESWNWSRRRHDRAMMSVRSTGRVTVIAANGGDPKHRSGRYFDIGAREFQLIGTRIGPVGSPAIRLRSGVQLSALLGVGRLSLADAATGGAHLEAYSFGYRGVTINRANVRHISPSTTAVSALTRMLAAARPHLTGWGITAPRAIPDPVGSNWAVDRRHRPDSAEYIQSLVDSRGVAYLPAGTYYISRPIRLGPNEGIVGAGQSRTAIVAKSPAIDVIVAVRRTDHVGQSRFMLVDLTLQGGRNGIVTDGSDAGRRTQFNRVFLSHVTIRNMAGVGILVRGIYGWDNNFIDNVTFYRCAVAGIEQVVEGGWEWRLGEKSGMTYMDKNVFYRCQFAENGVGVDFRAQRADNLNAFIGCSFRGNHGSAATLRNNNSTIFADSRFVANGGGVTIQSDKPVYIVDSSFSSGPRGRAFLPPGAVCDGCQFDQGGGGRAVVNSEGGRLLLLNSSSSGVRLGAPESGILINSYLPGNPAFNHPMTVLDHGVPQVVTGVRLRAR